MATKERVDEKTPCGGAYSEIIYLDDEGNMVDELDATWCVIHEYAEDRNLLNETIGTPISSARN